MHASRGEDFIHVHSDQASLLLFIAQLLFGSPVSCDLSRRASLSNAGSAFPHEIAHLAGREQVEALHEGSLPGVIQTWDSTGTRHTHCGGRSSQSAGLRTPAGSRFSTWV